MSKYEQNTEVEQIVNTVLKMDPGFRLSEGFSDKLMLKFEKHFAWDMYLKEFMIYLGAAFGILIVSIAMFFFLMSESWGKLIELFVANTGTVIGVAILLIFILFADKVLLRYFSYKLEAKRNRNS